MLPAAKNCCRLETGALEDFRRPSIKVRLQPAIEASGPQEKAPKPMVWAVRFDYEETPAGFQDPQDFLQARHLQIGWQMMKDETDKGDIET